jgi:hypothetical protein
MTGRNSFSLRVAAIPLLIATIVILETRQPFGMFRLATFCAIFLLLADIVLLLRGNWRDFAFVLASLAFGIFLIEAAGNIWGPRDPIVLSPDGLYAPRPVVGWGPSLAGRFPNERIDPERVRLSIGPLTPLIRTFCGTRSRARKALRSSFLAARSHSG